MKAAVLVCCAAILLTLGACRNPAGQNVPVKYKDNVRGALKQGELTDVSVDEEPDENTITLGGTVHSDDAKQTAAKIAKGAAGDRVIVNEISVQPVGAEADAETMASDIDGEIEKNYKAALIAHRLNKQHINFSAKNGVLTLKGSVATADERKEAQTIAAGVPNVQQVLNQIGLKR